MDKEAIMRKMRAGNFKENNGIVLRTINILRHEYNKLKGISYALPNLDADEFLDSVNYLHEAGYIHLRDTETKAEAVTGLADIDWRQLEGKLTAKGIRLLAGGIADECVKV
jgi:hypothetical protein